MFERVISLVGKVNWEKLKTKTVLVVGLGGVGGYATEALVRSGVKNLILIDYDKIDISNLNRQIITNKNNIGKYKTDVMKEHILSINKDCNVIVINTFLNNETISQLDNYQIDYIVDACDSVQAKKLLIDYALEKNIKLIASMGTANKLDPEKLTITDIRKTTYDPLAKILRKYVIDKKTNKKVMVVSTTEVPIKKDVLASMMFVPATAGILCAKYVVNDIINN